MKKFLGFVLAAMLACAAFGQAAKAPVTLSIVANQDWVTKPYMKAAWANYEKVTGNKLDIQALPIDNWEVIMKTRAAAGELPDIVMTFAGPALDAMRPADNFIELTKEAFVKDLKSFVMSQATYKGKVYGLPLWEGSISGTLYNKEIFKKLSIAVPTTQDEFWAACDTLKKAGITPIYLAFKDIWPALPQFGLDAIAQKYPNFVERLNSNKLKLADLPEMTKLVEFYKTLVDKGYLGADFASNTWDGQAQALGEGKYAMTLAWDQYLYSDLEPKYPGAADKFGIMPFFMNVNKEGSYEGPNACLTYANKKSKHAKEALDFIRFLAKPENLNIAYQDVFTETYFKSVTTNKASPQVVEARASVDKLVLGSVQAGIIGYSQVESVKPLQLMMLFQASVADTVKQIDAIRIKVAKARGLAGF
jgi:raffinose/stachyose/melibiose transport system substrate-binding protein